MSENPRQHPSWLLGNNFSACSSYLAPGILQQNYPDDRRRMKELASKILRDPLLSRKLCDRIYQLMQEDIISKQERLNNYRGWY